MKTTALLTVLTAAVACSSAVAATPVDPRVCDLTRPTVAAQQAVCAQEAASLALRRAMTARLDMKILWTSQITCTPKAPTFLHVRCTWTATPTPAATVTWAPATFKPSVAFGPAAVSFIAAAKQRLAAIGG